jgi:hypothetical protein
MINPFKIFAKYQCLLQKYVDQQTQNERLTIQKYVDQQTQNERLTIQNRKLLARSERFRLAAISTEKQKGALQIKIKELEDCHDHHSWTRCENEIAQLTAILERADEVINKQRSEILELEESEARLIAENTRLCQANRAAVSEVHKILIEAGMLEEETFGVRATH